MARCHSQSFINKKHGTPKADGAVAFLCPSHRGERRAVKWADGRGADGTSEVTSGGKRSLRDGEKSPAVVAGLEDYCG